MEPPILDRDRLKLITRGNAALAEVFLGALYEEADELIDQLTDLVGGTNCLAVSNIAHSLKGMAAELGAMQLRHVAADLEAEPDPVHWSEHLQRIRGALADLRAQ